MATSGSFNFNVTFEDICKEALTLIGEYDENDVIDNRDVATCLRTFNMMIKYWQADGVTLWKLVDAVLFLAKGTHTYSIGPSGDHASDSYVKTEVATAAASGASTLVVDSITGISASDNIGIELDDGTLQWTTVNGAPSGSTITLTDVTTDTIAVDNHVYTYTNKLQRPLEIVEARLRNSSGQDRPIFIESRERFLYLNDKAQTGTVNQIYHQPTTTNTTMRLWQAAGDVKELVRFSVKIPVEDVDTKTDNVDFPQVWFLPLAWQLALYVGPKFDASLNAKQEARAQHLLETVKDHDTEQSSSILTADLTGRRQGRW